VTNVQLYLALGIPSVLVILAWLSNRQDFRDLRNDMTAMNTNLGNKIDSLRSEMAAELRAVRSDINTVTKMYGEHGERIARLEERPR